MTLPHVTEILSGAGLVDPTYFTEEARLRGTALHLATQFLDQGELDWNTVDPAILQRLRQYQRFLEQVGPAFQTIEETVTNPEFGYCGRLDRRVLLGGRQGILDIKGPYESPWHGVQLAGYAGCFRSLMKRWTLHLSDDRYQLVEHTDRDDWEIFKAALLLNQWRAKHGV